MKFLKRQRQSKGFTLTELAVVIAVIAVLIAVLVPTFVSLLKSANESAQQQDAKNINTTLSTSTALNGTPESIGDVIDLLVAEGYPEELTSNSSDAEYIWVKEDNIIVLYNFTANVSIYPENYDLTGKTYYYFSSNATETKGFAAGSGTVDNPYVVATSNQLESLRNHISLYGTTVTASTSGSYAAASKKVASTSYTYDYAYFTLDRDLELGTDWTPLGTTTYVGDYYSTSGVWIASPNDNEGFIGHFDGNGHTITISDSNYSNGRTDYALFANVLYDGKTPTIIENLNIVMDVQSVVREMQNSNGNHILDVAPYSCSGVAANAFGNGENSIQFKNITVSGTIKAGAVAAGIAASADGCTFENCVNKANITTRSTNYPGYGEYEYTTLGGICGEAGHYYNVADTSSSLYNHNLSTKFVNCENYGVLTFKSMYYDYSDAETEYIYWENNGYYAIYNIGNIAAAVTGASYSSSVPAYVTFSSCKSEGDIFVYRHDNDNDILNFEGTYYLHTYVNYDTKANYTEDGMAYTTYTSTANSNKLLIGGNLCSNTVIDGTTYKPAADTSFHSDSGKLQTVTLVDTSKDEKVTTSLAFSFKGAGKLVVIFNVPKTNSFGFSLYTSPNVDATNGYSNIYGTMTINGTEYYDYGFQISTGSVYLEHNNDDYYYGSNETTITIIYEFTEGGTYYFNTDDNCELATSSDIVAIYMYDSYSITDYIAD